MKKDSPQELLGSRLDTREIRQIEFEQDRFPPRLRLQPLDRTPPLIDIRLMVETHGHVRGEKAAAGRKWGKRRKTYLLFGARSEVDLGTMVE